MEIKTIGYSQLGFEKKLILDNLKEIIKPNILIVDVRATPYGLVNVHELRKTLGIQNYTWVREFGNPNFYSEFDIGCDKLKEKLSRRAGIDTIIFMCAETKPEKCHREDIARRYIKKRSISKFTNIIRGGNEVEGKPKETDRQYTLFNLFSR